MRRSIGIAGPCAAGCEARGAAFISYALLAEAVDPIATLRGLVRCPNCRGPIELNPREIAARLAPYMAVDRITGP